MIFKGYLFFRNTPLPQISTFSLGQKGCAYYEKSAYYEWAQYVAHIIQYFKSYYSFDLFVEPSKVKL